jgi:hypothetical protein
VTAPAGVPDFPEDVAAWIREHVWLEWHRIHEINLPGSLLRCACEEDRIRYAHVGEHCPCARYLDPFAPRPESVIRSPRGHARVYGTYRHELRTPNGRRPEFTALVWLADRLCRPYCSCDCHHHQEAAPGEQASLFPAGATISEES